MRTTSVGPGDVVADRQLTDLLGSGGEGEVWEAVRPDGSRCALKLVRPEVLPSPEEVRRRGRWLVRIDHPALVRVSRGGRFTAGSLAGWGFVEMDLITGPSLQDVGPVPDALPRLAGVAEALDLLHAGTWSEGVPLVHRDVKPGNLIGAGGGLVLVDPSTMRGLDTRELTRVGTPAYVAPEVATGRFGPLVDVYSLAATAAALITGARGGGLAAVIDRPWDHGLPEAVCAALDPDPGRRPGTCGAVIEGRVVLLGHAGTGHPLADEGWTGIDDVGEAPSPGGPSWSVAALAAVLVVPSTIWAIGRTQPSLVPDGLVGGALLAGVVGHLVVHLLTRRPSLGLLAPPWAWGDLVAGRGDRPDTRTLWLADVVAGTLAGAAMAMATVAVSTTSAALVPGIALASVAAVVLWRRLAMTSSRLAWAPVWALTLPLRLLGAVPRLLVTGTR